MTAYLAVLIVALCHMGHVLSFEIIQNEIVITNQTNTTQEGESVVLKCVTNDWYEYCLWQHKERVCEFEWKRDFGAVRKQKCDQDLKARVQFVGKYSEHECAIQVSNITLSDGGEWTCELESYVWGPISGSKDTARIYVGIESESDYSNQTTTSINTTTQGNVCFMKTVKSACNAIYIYI